MTRMVTAGFLIGAILICIGLVLPLLWKPLDLQIDPGPTPVQIASSEFIFTGLNVIIISAIFFFRNAIRIKKKEAGHSQASGL
jgi:hypothetical protein